MNSRLFVGFTIWVVFCSWPTPVAYAVEFRIPGITASLAELVRHPKQLSIVGDSNKKSARPT
jgi:hypothetical protein